MTERAVRELIVQGRPSLRRRTFHRREWTLSY